MIRYYLSESARANGIIQLSTPNVGDAGYDIRSNENIELHPRELATVTTGLHLQIPFGMVGILKDRSSMARAGLHVTGGVIDASYRGEILVLIENRGRTPYRIAFNDRIVQMVVVACHTENTVQVENLEELGDTDRGAAGFGSTGVN